MKYAKINGLEKDISKLVFGTAVGKLFAVVAFVDNDRCV